jgi:PTH1 family peptidyl-tRNA hydrolase
VQRYGLHLKKPFLKPWLAASFPHASGQTLTLIKPQTFMNLSGEIFHGHSDFQPSEERRILVFCDQMDLPPGSLRLKRTGGTAGHNGLKSLAEAIGSSFSPLYIGVGRPEAGVSVVDHVLGVPGEAELQLILASLERAVEGLEVLFDQGFEPAVGLMNRKDGANTPA